MLIIGLGHKARRGKGTAAQAIIDARGGDLDIRQYGFGDLLKQEVNEAAVAAGGMFALHQDLQLHGALLPNGQRLLLDRWVTFDHNAPMDDLLCPMGKQRKLLQWWGSEYRRVACNKFYWVKAMAERLRAEQPQVALITDVRFQNEYLWIKANSGFTIKVDRVGYVDVDTNASHYSENELNGVKFDFEIVVPEGGLDELKADAVTVFDTIVEALTPREVMVDDVAA